MHIHYVLHAGKDNAKKLIEDFNKQEVRIVRHEGIASWTRRLTERVFKTQKYPDTRFARNEKRKLRFAEDLNKIIPKIEVEQTDSKTNKRSSKMNGGYPTDSVNDFLITVVQWAKKEIPDDYTQTFDVDIAHDRDALELYRDIISKKEAFEKLKSPESCRDWLESFCKFNEYREEVMIRRLNELDAYAKRRGMAVGVWVGAVHKHGLQGRVDFASSKDHTQPKERGDNFFNTAILDYKRHGYISDDAVQDTLEAFGLVGDTEV